MNGIYILGNDRVYDFATTCIKSIRRWNSEMPIALIPFDERIDRLSSILGKCGGEVLEDALMEKMDSCGHELWGEEKVSHRMFRKFCAFWGPFDQFLYLDADIAMLSDPQALFEIFGGQSLDFMSFDSDFNRVYHVGAFREQMIANGSKGFNAGHFMGRRGVIAPADVERLVQAAKNVRHEFQDKIDQSFLNFAVDELGLKHRRLVEIDHTYADKQWGDLKRFREVSGQYVLSNRMHQDNGKKMPFIHWSGHQARSNFANKSIFYKYRLDGETLAYKLRFVIIDMIWWRTGLIRKPWGFFAHKFKRLRQRLGLS